MRFPNISCKIQIVSEINPSEDSDKVKQSILNILPECEIEINDSSITAKANSLESLEQIYESIQSTKSQNVFRRHLERNMNKETTWFYLNKQAAFVKKVVLCDEADESPLGPLKVILASSNIDQIIDLFTKPELAKKIQS